MTASMTNFDKFSEKESQKRELLNNITQNMQQIVSLELYAFEDKVGPSLSIIVLITIG
jgi:hypothetical protein